MLPSRAVHVACLGLALLLLAAGYALGMEPVDRPIAFVSERDGNPEIYVVNPDGSGLRNLSQHPADDTLPKWSPDGTHIAFLSDRDRGTRLWVMDADGGRATPLQLADGEHQWMPNGAAIVYRQGETIYAASVEDPGHRETLSVGKAFAVSPEGSRLAVSATARERTDSGHQTRDTISIVDIRSRSTGAIHWVDGSPGSKNIEVFAPVWHADASRVILSWVSRTAHHNINGGEVFSLAPDGSDPVSIGGRATRALSVSPDGSKLLFSTLRHSPEPLPTRLYITDLNGSNEVELEPPALQLERPSWGPGSARLVGQTQDYEPSSVHLYITSVDGSEHRLLTPSGYDADWQRSALDTPAALPSIGIRTPGPNRKLSAGTKSMELRIARDGYDGPWQWRLNGQFPASGAGGGATVGEGDTATIGDLEDGHHYTVDVAYVDGSGGLLMPRFRVSRGFSVAYGAGSPLIDRTRFAAAAGGDIVVMDLDGGSPLRLTSGDGQDREPDWSPDGSLIAYTTTDDGDPYISVVASDGSGGARLTQDGLWGRSPAWSPDGSQIAFAGSRGGLPQIYVMRADGSNPRRLTAVQNYAADPTWSPDGSHIAFSAVGPKGKIHTIRVADGYTTQITFGPGQHGSPAWSPQGHVIAFGRRPGGILAYQLHMLYLDGGHEVAVGGYTGEPTWSPDGSQLLTSVGGLTIRDADGSNPRPMALGASSGRQLDWSTLPPTTAIRGAFGAGLSRFAPTADLLAVSADSGYVAVQRQQKTLFASQLIEAGITLCARLRDGGAPQVVVGREGVVLAGLDFAIEPGGEYIVNTPRQVDAILHGLSSTLRARRQDDGWAFAVAGASSSDAVAMGGSARVTMRASGAEQDARIDSGKFVALFIAGSGGPTAVAGATVTVVLTAHAGVLRATPYDYEITAEDIRVAFATFDMDARPDALRALPNYPNPFNPETWLPFQLDRRADVSIRIYDAGGALVRLLELGPLDAGYNVSRSRAARWDGRNGEGEAVAAGVYVTELRAGERRLLRRMVVGK